MNVQSSRQISPGQGKTVSCRSARRGVLLLVVLSLLTLFMLLGMTFLIMSSRARTTAQAFLRLSEESTQISDAFAPHIREAALQVIRGTNRSTSALRFHDLLADKYGSAGGAEYGVSDVQFVAGGQILRMELSDLLVNGSLGPAAAAGNFSGRVLTYLDGPTAVKNKSVRIITSLDVNGENSNVIYVERPRGVANPADLINEADSGSPSNQLEVWINDREYSGTGFQSDELRQPNWSLTGGAPMGSPNEDYDAWDQDNFVLASSGSQVMSLARADSIDYWKRNIARRLNGHGSALAPIPGLLAAPANTTPSTPFEAELANLLKTGTTPSLDATTLEIATRFRRATVRPFAFDHTPDGATDFTGRPISSTGLTAIVDEPEVDSDGDGTLDSFWVDLGQPPVSVADGKLVKPLFAIKCIDLGGRLNLNAHGSPMHLQAANAADGRLTCTGSNGQGTLDTTEPKQIRQGIGYGPLDVRLATVTDPPTIPNPNPSPDTFEKIVLGTAPTFGASEGMRRDLAPTLGRYGDAVGNTTNFPTNVPRAGTTGILPAERSYRTANTNAWAVTDRGVPSNYWQSSAPAASLGLYGGSPPDFWGRLAVGLSHRGHPLYLNAAPSLSDTGGVPYATDLSAPKQAAMTVGQTTTAAWVDQPFAPAELEALLRAFDADNTAILPQRLLTLALSSPSMSTRSNMHALCTTESWDTPAVVGGPPNFIGATSFDRELFDHDLVRGLKMNLNRPFGDGADNTGGSNPGAGTVDEPDETDPDTGTSLTNSLGGWQITRGRLPSAMLPGELLEQPGPNTPGLRARQVYAFHLYNLMDQIRRLADPVVQGLLCTGVWTGQDTNGTTAFTRRDPNVFSLVGQTRKVIAQWAVNVVDFMDSDAIMTPFMYDTSVPPVWGCEAPDLLITETVAFHDRGIDDTATDNGRAKTVVSSTSAADGDRNWDQVKLPQGSLFIELHAIRDPELPNPPRELYDGATGLLDLGRKPTGSATKPIWRLALTNLRTTPNIATNEIFERLKAHPDTAWLQPAYNATSDALIEGIQFNRFIWFTANAPTGATPGIPNASNTFHLVGGGSGGATPSHERVVTGSASNSPSAVIGRGEFLVVGPWLNTPLGSKPSAPETPSPQSISLGPVPTSESQKPAVDVRDFAGEINPTVKDGDGNVFIPPGPPSGLPDGFRRETKACWVGSRVSSSGWSGSGWVSGLNISEPDVSAYYQKPTSGSVYTRPLDNIEDILGGGLEVQGTHSNVATVFLQRLADPTRDHEPDATSSNWNPYITVDFMPIDLTVFNGCTDNAESRKIAGTPVSGDAPLIPDTSLPPDKPFHFHTRQRGLTTLASGSAQNFDLRQIAVAVPVPTLSGTSAFAANPYVPAYPAHVNHPPGPSQTAQTTAEANFKYLLGRCSSGSDPIHTLGWTNISFGRRLEAGRPPGIPPAYDGSPSTPLPWITWNDRPFANPYELLLVPATPAGRLFTNYRNPSRTATEKNLDNTDAYGHFGHLFPFTALNDPPKGTPARSRNSDVFSRLFSYVRVPSPYAGTAKPLVPWTPALNQSDPSAPMERFLPPFNLISTYREPGRVNLNTIDRAAGEPVWNALFGAKDETTLPEGTPNWMGFLSSGTRSISVDSLPTNVSQPWRDLGNAAIASLRVSGTLGVVPEAALSGLRPGGPTNGLFFTTGTSVPIDVARVFSPRSYGLFRDADPMVSNPVPWMTVSGSTSATIPTTYATRNAWFALEPIIRAGAQTTVRSEVYAIWITVGFFEVESVPSTKFTGTTFSRFPDGYRLLREYGSQTGDIRRHRGFYIFDRSIPVGYKPGADMNVEDAILVERLIE
jgi:hypothetical protein